MVGAGAKVLGAIHIGKKSRIGANAVVVKEVPEDSVVVGVPGQIVKRSHPQLEERFDLNHNNLPDAIGQSLLILMEKMDKLESKIDINLTQKQLYIEETELTVESDNKIHSPVDGVWSGEDFSI